MSRFVGAMLLIVLALVIPLMIKSELMCDESINRVELRLDELTHEVSSERELTLDMVSRYLNGIAAEPDLYDTEFMIGIRYVMGTQDTPYYEFISGDELYTILVRERTIQLYEGDLFSARSYVSSPGMFSRISGRDSTTQAYTIRNGCRIGREGAYEERV